MPLSRIVLALLFAVALAAPASAAPAGGAAIVLDASAGMLNKIGNRTKVDIARVAIDQVLKKPPAGLPIGLVAFGHRNRTSCSDVEVAVAPATGSAEPIANATKALKPVGRASVVAAVKAAATALEYETKPANIVLVTGAVEACAADPCALGIDLEADGNDMTVTVIGLGLTREQGRAVACLAEATGGSFVSAANQDELIAALDRAIKIEPELPLPSASVKGPAKVEQGSTFDVAWTGPKEKGDLIQIAWPGMKPGQHIRSIQAKSGGKSDGKPGSMIAPASRGTYELRYYLPSRDKILARQAFEVVDGQARLIAPERVSQGGVFTVTWKGPFVREDQVEIGRAGAAAALAKASLRQDSGEAVLDAPAEPGTYELRFRAAGEPAAKGVRPLVVTPADIRLEAPAQIAGGAEFPVNWAGPAAPRDEIEIATASMPDSQRLQASRVDEPGKPVMLDAPAEGGDFVLRYRSGKSGVVLKRVPVRVAKASATLEGPSDAEGGARIEVKWTGPGARNDEIGIAPAGSPAGRDSGFTPVSADSRTVALDLPVTEGSYELRYWSARSRAVLATKTIRIRKPNVALQAPAAVKVGQSFSVTWTGPNGRFDDLRIGLPTADGEQALRSAMLAGAGKPVTLLAPDKPGTYMLRYWSAKNRTVLGAVALRVE